MTSDKKNQELINIFLEEAGELVDVLKEVLQQWQTDLLNISHISDFKRELHTLKGAACMVGQKEVTHLARELENLCDHLIKGNISMDQKIFALVSEGLDLISLMIGAIQKNESIPPSDLILQKMNSYIPNEAKSAQQNNELTNTSSQVTPNLKNEVNDFSANNNSLLVMIVDDSATTRAILQLTLYHHHYQVMMAENGEDALSKLQKIPQGEALPDIIILDIDMPKMNGLEFAKILRDSERFNNIPIIILSAEATAIRREQAKALDIELFLQKPIDESQIILSLRSLTTALSKNRKNQ